MQIMLQPRTGFKPVGIPDTALNRLRSTPSYFFLIWRWSMWFYALTIILWFKTKYIGASYNQTANLLLVITFIQTLFVTLYAPIFQKFLPRLKHQNKVILSRKTQHIGQHLRAADEELEIVPALLQTRNVYWDIAIYSLDVIICGLVMYYSGPFADPPFGSGSPFYRYGLSTALAAALTYRYRGGLIAAVGYDLFAILGMLFPAPGAPHTYPTTIIDVIGSLIDAPVAALLAAFFATLIKSYAHSKWHEQQNARTQRALVQVGETLMKNSGDREALLQNSAFQIRHGGHFHRTIIALFQRAEGDGEQLQVPPTISTIVDTTLPDDCWPNKQDTLLQEVRQSQQKLISFEPLDGDENMGYGIARFYLPLHKDGQIQLILGAESRRTTPFDQRKEEFLTIAGAQLLIALDNIRLADQMVELAAAAERGRIAREIHDGIAQLVYMLSLTAETCEAQAQRIAEAAEEDAELLAPLTARLGKLVTISKQALWETRNYMFSLKPLMSGTTTLTQMITNQVREFETISDLPIQLEMNGNEEIHSEDRRHSRRYAQIGAALFRIVQEALTNAYKHANATQLEVSLHFKAETIEVTICDNGCGLAADNEQEKRLKSQEQTRIYSGHGMGGMHERAQELGGTCLVETRPQGGVKIRACIPL